MRKSQTATEYLIILAVVIVIALIVVGVLGGIPGIGSSSSKKANDISLRSKSVGIEQYAVSNETSIFTIRNNLPESIRITSFNLGATACNISTFILEQGQTKKIECNNIYEATASSFEYDTTISYTKINSGGTYTQDDMTLHGDVAGVISSNGALSGGGSESGGEGEGGGEITPLSFVNFISPTFANATSTASNSIPINVSINTTLSELVYNWVGTDYTLYDNSLVLMMNMEDLSDASLSGYTATNNGATQTSLGKYGGAYSFDGTNDYISVGSSFGLGDTEFSMAVWTNLNAAGVYRKIVEHNINGCFLLDVYDSGFPRFNVCSDDSYVIDSSGSISGWTFLVGTAVENDNVTFYVDGKLIGSTTTGGFGTISSSAFAIGADRRGTSSYYNGLIDEVMIWNRALSAAEVQQLYMSSLQKYNETQWYLYVDQAKNATANLDSGTYTYQVTATDGSANTNSTEVRTVTIT